MMKIADQSRLSQRWFDHERRTWVRLLVWSYLLIGLAFAPLLFGVRMAGAGAYVWLGVLVAGIVALCTWLAVRITRSVRLGRADLRQSSETASSEAH